MEFDRDRFEGPATTLNYTEAARVLQQESEKLGLLTGSRSDPSYWFELDRRIKHELEKAEKARFKATESLWFWATAIALFVSSASAYHALRGSGSYWYFRENRDLLCSYLLLAGARSFFSRDNFGEGSFIVILFGAFLMYSLDPKSGSPEFAFTLMTLAIAGNLIYYVFIRIREVRQQKASL